MSYERNPIHRHPYVPSALQDELHERARFAADPRFGIPVTLASRSGDSTRLTFHRASELPWNRNRRPAQARGPR